MSDERDVVLKCPSCGEMCTAKFSPYMRERSVPCPVCGKDIPIQTNVPAPPPPPLGTETPTPPPMPAARQEPKANALPARKTCGMAIAGMVLGITSIVPGMVCCGPLLALLGLIFSGQALYRINRQPLELEGKGMAIAGLVTSIIGLLLALAALVMMTFFGAMMKAAMDPLLKMMPPGPVK